MKRDKYIYLFLLLALLLRLVAINARPLWYDEAIAALVAEQGPNMILYSTLTSVKGSAANVHPPAYFMMLWGWIKIFGGSVIALRSLSVFFGLGILLWVYFLGKLLFNEWTSLYAVALVALSPFQVHYAQEARMYTLLTFFLLGATYALWKGIVTRRWTWWLLFMFCSALAQYTHNLAFFHLITLACISLLKRDWGSMRSVFFSGLGAMLLYSPWLVHLPAQFDKVQTSYWVPAPTPARLITTLLSFVTNLPLPDSWLPVALFVTLAVTFLGAWQMIRAWRAGREGVHSALWMAYLAFITPLMLYLFSLWQPVYIERALLPSGVFFLIWLTWTITQTQLPKVIRWFAIVLLMVGMSIGIFQHINYRGFPYGPYRALDKYLVREISSEDRIIHSNKLTMLPMVYYNRDLPHYYVTDEPGSGSDTLALPTQQALDLIADPNLQFAVEDTEKVWFVIFSKAIEEYKDEGYKTHPHILWLEDNFILERIEIWDDIRLYVYVRK